MAVTRVTNTNAVWPQDLEVRETQCGAADPVGITGAEVLADELNRRRLAAGMAACNEPTLPRTRAFRPWWKPNLFWIAYAPIMAVVVLWLLRVFS